MWGDEELGVVGSAVYRGSSNGGGGMTTSLCGGGGEGRVAWCDVSRRGGLNLLVSLCRSLELPRGVSMQRDLSATGFAMRGQ